MAEPLFAWRHVPVKRTRAPGRSRFAPWPSPPETPWPTLRLPTVEFREQPFAVERDRFFGTTADLTAGSSTGIWAATSLPGATPAQEEILDHLGRQHITAHANFTALEEHGTRYGFGAERIETQAQTLLAAGFEEQFGAAPAWGGLANQGGRRLQPKTLAVLDRRGVSSASAAADANRKTEEKA